MSAERSPMQLFHVNKLWGPINAKPDPCASLQSHHGVTEIQLVTPQRETRITKDTLYWFCFSL